MADSRPADCELTVGGRTYIKGVCQFTPESDGSFQISGGDYFAYVNVTSPGVAEASWNENPASTHAHTRLGPVTRSGACWVGTGTRICARALSQAAERAAVAAQPNGQALFPETALQACLGVEGALEVGAKLVLHNCRVPSDLIFVRRQDGSLGVSRRTDLCLGLEGPGMPGLAQLVLEACQAASPRWTTRATATEATPVQSSTGMCLTIPQLEVADARFPFAVQAVPCASAGSRAVPFILSRG
ncbi:hypothetical protein KPL78_12190 [Roseomonas sp. HJA6]|uniref:Ricin B lectin domain-containing protein n=1 Tax=Roseomonas alba TaxID=2846776 RepID=A0ABS7ABD7_9PROT|nr:hypothetical protein [Neoroseomonas alba]MBW6398615.1 hypothetical protein [Neoroseomonas alba]